MHFVSPLSLWLVCLMSFATPAWQLPHGSCSQRCQKLATDSNSTSTGGLHSCSCSSSCSIYGDCCFDSIYRDTAKRATSSRQMCIALAAKGQFQAISKCPRDWSGSSSFCRESIGHQPPVTSTITGTTYTNIYCAFCHGDGEKLKTWNVELRCCPEHDHLVRRRYIYHNGYLWSRVSKDNKCPCSFVSHNNNTSFANSLELRSCDRRLEISTCSPSWGDETVKELCASYLDPLYVGSRIYRNLYCAQCNYERLARAKCMPAVVERKLSEGLDVKNIFDFCQTHHLSACLHYLTSFSRGKSYSFSKLLNIRELTCMPSPGKRCCEGERYDFRAKRCRQLFSGML